MGILSKVGAFAAAAALLAPAAAFAGTAGPQNFQVTATVVPMCTNLTATDMAFGNYNTFSSTAGQANSTVSFQCTIGSQPEMQVGFGSNASGNQRRMASGTSYLSYGIYQEQSFAEQFLPWVSYYVSQAGTTSSITPAPLTSSSPVNVTLYGQLPALQDVPVGSYSDTVQVTLEY